MLLQTAYDKFIERQAIGAGLKPATIDHYFYAKKLAVDYWGGSFALCDITPERIPKWTAVLGARLKPDTVRYALMMLRCMLRYWNMMGEKVMCPDLIKLPRMEQREVNFLEVEQVHAFVEAVSQPHRNLSEEGLLRNIAIVKVLFSSGVRVSELLQLDIGDIYKREFTAMGKSKNPRQCYISDDAERCLIRYMEARDYNKNKALFTSITGERGRLSYSACRNVFVYACDHSEDFKKVTPHTMRHSFATYLMDNDLDIRLIAAYCGHESIQTTMRYTHTRNKDLRMRHSALAF